MTKLYGSLEAGGTKFVCAVGDENFNVVEKHNFQQQLQSKQSIKPLSSSQNSITLLVLQLVHLGRLILTKLKTYGFITTTPKPNWANVDLLGALRRALNVPMYFTTDVNSSAYGEVVARNNAGGRIENLVYYTIGTGIGAGVIQRGEFIGGVGHPEMGHYYVARHPMDIEKSLRVFVLSIRDVWKAMQLVQVWKLVQVYVGKLLNSTTLFGMFKPTISLKLRLMRQ